MSSPPDDSRSRKRVMLPPIRDFFRDEFMDSQPPTQEPPSAILARLRMSDDGSEPPSIRPLSPRPSPLPTRMHRSTSEQTFPSASHRSTYYAPSTTPPYQGHYASVNPSSTSTTQSHASGSQLADFMPGRRPPEALPFHSPASMSPHSPNQRPDLHMISSSQFPYPSYTQSSSSNSNEPQSHTLSQMDRLPIPQNSGGSTQVHGPDSPPALVQAVAPWVIATNLDVGQIYEDDERTPIARPFDAGPMGRSTSHAVSLGRYFDDGSQTPLGKYDCKFCGKLFNRPSSLRIHLNSHTGEKPFVCPHPDCGRSFSVLSNMRRHARVHMNNPKEQAQEESNDEASSQPSPTAPSTPGHSSMAQEAAPMQALTRSQSHYRQDSNASETSSSSRRSRNTPSEGGQMEEVEWPDKRSRHRPG